MIYFPEIIEHLKALALIWLVTSLTGAGFVDLLPAPWRYREGWLAAPLLGVAYWSCALYVFPFPGGLYLAGLLVCLMLYRISRAAVTGFWPEGRHWLPAVVLVAGCVVYMTPLVTQYVPSGMDASMHATNARMIAAVAGLPMNYAPMAPEIDFVAANLGLPTVAAIVVLLGCTPVAATLAAQQLTFSCVVLGCYQLFRLGGTRMTAAVMAVATTWFARGIQGTYSWGGFPTVMGVVLGLVAARLLLDTIRRPLPGAIVPLGLCVAALPLVHGIAAATWLYVVGPLASIAGFLLTRRRMAAIRILAGAAVWATTLLGAYLFYGKPNSRFLSWIRSANGRPGTLPPSETWVSGLILRAT